MKPKIKSLDKKSEFYISEGCYITELSNSIDDPTLSIAQARVPPGTTTRWHQLDGITERYCITQGTGVVEIGDLEARTVHCGDVVIIPPLCRQRIHNNGTEDLIFLALCTPRFSQQAYHELE